MANIISVSPLASWFLREQPVSSKFNSELKNKMNSLISNHVIINNGLEQLIQGASGGAQQAKILFGLAAAPTGWTRDASVPEDRVLRVTDGVTLPPSPQGSSPTAIGGENGGQDGNIIVGFGSDTVGSHTHDLANHTHILANHTHSMDNHTHGVSHTHTMLSHPHTYPSSELGEMRFFIDPFNSVENIKFEFGAGVSVAQINHSHTNAAHTHTASGFGILVPGSDTGTETGNPTSLPGSGGSGGSISNGPSTNTSGSTGLHSHSISNDGTWRPSYLNVLLCKKD